MFLTRLDGVYYTTNDLASIYNQVPLSQDTKKLTSFVFDGKQYTFEQRFHGLRGLPNFFSRIRTIHFAEMIARRQAITYIGDVIFQATNKAEMWKNLESNFKCLRSSALKAAPKKQTLLEESSIPWTHCFRQRISTSSQKVPRPKKLKSPEEKRVVMPLSGSLRFYSTLIQNLQVDSKHFFGP